MSTARPPTAVERQCEELLRAVCHDIRSHLTGALVGGQLLRDEAERRGLDEAARRAATVVSAAHQIDALVEDLSESARIACGRLELRPTLLQLDLLLPALLRHEGRAPPDRAFDPARVTVRAAADVPAVLGDAARLERALGCLIAHAQRVAVTAQVEVALTAADGEVRVTVSDHGPGIPRDQLSRVFGRCFRPPGAPGGIGVGLFIARKVVEAHGGRVWVESEDGHGATYGVALPTAASRPRRSARPRRDVRLGQLEATRARASRAR